MILKGFALKRRTGEELGIHYRELLGYLYSLKADAASARSHLNMSLDSLVAVIRFLEVDPDVQREDLARPLHIFAAAIHNTLAGARSPLFEISPVAHRPSGTIHDDAVRPVCAAILELFLDAGKDQKESASLIAHHLAVIGVKLTENKPISGKTVIGWRHEMGARIVGVPLNVYRQMIGSAREQLGNNPSEKSVREFMISSLTALPILLRNSDKGAT